MQAQADRQACWQDCEKLGVAEVRARLMLASAADPQWRAHAQDWLQTQLQRQAHLTYRLVLISIAMASLAIITLAIV